MVGVAPPSDNFTNGTVEAGEGGGVARLGGEREGDSEHSSTSGPLKDTRRRGGRRAHYRPLSLTPTPTLEHTPSSTSQGTLVPHTLPLSQLPDLRKLSKLS